MGNGGSATVTYVPDAPINLTRDEANTGKFQIGFSWEDGASDNGWPVEDYRIMYDQGTNTWVTLVQMLTTKMYIQSTGISPGVYYTYRIEARNVIGFSPPSVEVSILAATIPYAPSNVETTAIDNDVQISWTKPTSDYVADFGSDLIGFKVFI